jgi:hypothetical protein
MITLNSTLPNGKIQPIAHKGDDLKRVGEVMTNKELHEFGLFMFIAFLEGQDFEPYAINMNPENCAPDVMLWNPQKLLLYIWVKTDLAPNVPVYVPNETHDTIMKLCKEYHAVPSFASITISCATPQDKLIPKCGSEYYAMLNEFEEI